MIATTNHRLYVNTRAKGRGSILKAMRTDKGAGRGLIAGSIVLLVFTLPFSISCYMSGINVLISSLFSVPGFLMLVLGIVFMHKRNSTWVEYYQKESGFSEAEVVRVDMELTYPSVSLVICKNFGAISENHIACLVTNNYVVINGMDPYIRRLEDIIAAAFSDSMAIWYMVCLSKQDEDVVFLSLFAESYEKKAICWEMIGEMHKRNPNILCSQEIVCEGRVYILERDGAEILRLYKEGRKLEVASHL